MTATRPEATEYAPFYASYIERVPEGNIVELLEKQRQERRELLRTIAAENETYRYSEGKWSIREMVGHLIDAERVFSYRAHCISRGETASLPGFDENSYIAWSGYDERSLEELAEELDSLRAANLSMFRSFSDEMWTRKGIANNNEVTVRAIAYALAGHEMHHTAILRERYLSALPAGQPSAEQRVSGLGGIFFKARDPKALAAWYEQHLGMAIEDWGGAVFKWREAEARDRVGYTVWSPFAETTSYFEPSKAPFMINYRVAALAPFLERLRASGIAVDEKTEESELGKFGWLLDPEGNRIELWEPPA